MPDFPAITTRLVKEAARSAGLPESPRKDFDEDQDFLVEHQKFFASIYNQGIGTYYTRFDEALRHNRMDALSMRNDASIYELLRHRQYKVLSLPHHMKPDRPDDPKQKKACERAMKLVDATEDWEDLKLAAYEAVWYGRAGSQQVFRKDRVDGESAVICTAHQPIMGDKIVFGFDGTPGVLIYSTAQKEIEDKGGEVFRSDQGPALKLGKPYWRDRFIIHQHEPADFDYLYEADKAGGVHGIGLRDRIYWAWWLRQEVLAWCMNAMQRIGANGNFIGYFEMGNAASKEAVLEALKTFSDHGVTAFPRMPGPAGMNQAFDHIPPSAIAYEVMMRLIEYLDGIIRRAIVGQELTGTSASTGMNSNLADVHQDTLQGIQGYDAKKLASRLTRDFVRVLVKENMGDLPFKIRMVLEIESDDFAKKLASAQTFWSMGVDVDVTDLIAEAGLKAGKAGPVIAKAAQGMMGEGGGPGGKGGKPGAKPPKVGGEKPVKDTAPATIPMKAKADRLAKDDNSPERYAAEHAPHNINIGGKTYRGGEFIPGPPKDMVDHDRMARSVAEAQAISSRPNEFGGYNPHGNFAYHYEHGPVQSPADRKHLAKARARGKVAMVVQSGPQHHSGEIDSILPHLDHDEPKPPEHPGAIHHVVGGTLTASLHQQDGHHVVTDHLGFERQDDGSYIRASHATKHKTAEKAEKHARRLVKEYVDQKTDIARLATHDPHNVDRLIEHGNYSHKYETTFRVIDHDGGGLDRYSAQHAPHTMTIGGKEFRGGEFIPVDATKHTSPSKFEAVAYHGTDNDFDAFDHNKIGSSTDDGHLGHGFYFSTDPNVASGKRIRKHVEIKVNNPLNLKADSWAIDKKKLVRTALGLPETASAKDVAEHAKAKGHDAVILDYGPIGYHHKEIVVWDAPKIDRTEEAPDGKKFVHVNPPKF